MTRILIMAVIITTISLITSCGITDDNNPLLGKNTDERIVMALEETYPEHTFSVVRPYDKSIDEGIFKDENGIEFKVYNLVYDNTYHFAVTDDYLFTLLVEQEYIERIKSLLPSPEMLLYDDINVGLEIYIENIENGRRSVAEIAEIILSILNSVDTPTVVYPKDAVFSTGEVKFYSRPTWGNFSCSFDYMDKISTWENFYFDDKNAPESEIKERLESVLVRIQDELSNIEESEGGDANIPEEESSVLAPDDVSRTNVERDFGTYVVPEGWEENSELAEALSLDGKYLYLQSAVEYNGNSDYFTIGTGTNGYTENEHERFKEAILRQLMDAISNYPGVSLNASGSRTDGGYYLYTFILDKGDDTVETMNYIIGDKRYCLVHTGKFGVSDSVNEATQQVINSFVWNDLIS